MREKSLQEEKIEKIEINFFLNLKTIFLKLVLIYFNLMKKSR
jgi:hypothetical protein